MSRPLKLPLLCILLLLAPLGCGSAEVGEECDEVGDTDECEDGAICTNLSTEEDPGICLWLCENDDECAADEACNGIAGSNRKSCQPKT